MPNHIINIIRLTGDREKINELLESVIEDDLTKEYIYQYLSNSSFEKDMH